MIKLVVLFNMYWYTKTCGLCYWLPTQHGSREWVHVKSLIAIALYKWTHLVDQAILVLFRHMTAAA